MLGWVGLGWVGLGLFVEPELHGRDRGKHHLYHPYQLWIHITPILIVIHTEQFINKVFIKLYIFIIMLSLKNQTLINTRFVVLEYIYSVATLVIFHHVNNLVTENGFNINASLLTQVKLVFCIAGWKFPYIDLIL